MTLEAVVIYDSILFNRTGQVRRWAESLNARFVLNAKEAAPVRSGELAASIHGEVTRVGPRQLLTEITAEADHALYVLKGTTGPIYSDLAWAYGGNLATEFTDDGTIISRGWLKLRPGNGYGSMYRVSVSGQQANNFFAVAARKTAVRHSSLRGFSPQFGY